MPFSVRYVPKTATVATSTTTHAQPARRQRASRAGAAVQRQRARPRAAAASPTPAGAARAAPTASGERRQHPGQSADRGRRRLSHGAAPARRTAPVPFRQRSRWAGAEVRRRWTWPGRRRANASPRSWASSTQRHSCASRDSVSRPCEAVPVEARARPRRCRRTAWCAVPGRAHRPSMRRGAANRRPGTAASRRSRRRRWRPVLRAAGVGRGAAAASRPRSAGLGQAIAGSTPDARPPRRGTGRTDGWSRRRSARSGDAAAALRRDTDQRGARPMPAAAGRPTLRGRPCATAELDARPWRDGRECSSSRRKPDVAARRSRVRPRAGAARTPASVPWQWCMVTRPRLTSRNVSPSPRLLL